MRKNYYLAFTLFILIFCISQTLKYGFSHFDWNVDGPIMSLHLAYNRGVAFSMFAFLAEYLKYIQVFIMFCVSIYLYKTPDVFQKYIFPIALIYAGGLSNILDRFTYGAVVDFFYWHYLFDFAIFNFADVMIDLGVVLIIYMQIKENKKK